jgi:hypothetical protein
MDHYEDEESKDKEGIAVAVGKIAKTIAVTAPMIIDAIVVLGNKLRTVIASKKLTYDEAMKYFIEHKNANPTIAKGAMLKESAGESVVIFQVFLDKDNQLVENDKAGNSLGCKIKVKQLDDELLRLFKDGNLVIVE